MLKLDSRRNTPLSSVRFVTHKGTSLKIGITTKHGPKVRTKPLRFTTDHRLTPSVSKTTRFRQSKPVIEFKGEPPF
jgi:hypothetical protein